MVAKLEELAGDLENMHTFDWDGLELPEDRLWETLRIRYVDFLRNRVSCCQWMVPRCPKLKSVFSNVGTRPLDGNSQVICS